MYLGVKFAVFAHTGDDHSCGLQPAQHPSSVCVQVDLAIEM